MPVDQLNTIVSDAEDGKPDAQFRLSQVCHQNGDFDKMVHWLKQASASQHPDAMGVLGHCYEHGQSVSQDLAKALDQYSDAVAAGAKMPAFQKAQLLYKASTGPDQKETIRQLLIEAAQADIVPALRTIGYLALQHSSSMQLALDCLRRAAALGDTVSMFNLGWLLMQDQNHQDLLGESKYWLQQAAAANYPFAMSQLESNKAAASAPKVSHSNDIQFAAPFGLFPDDPEAVSKEISADPEIVLYQDVLNVVDCAYLMFVSGPHLQRASVINPQGDQQGMVSNVRTSMSTYIPFELVDIMSRYIELKIVLAAGEELDFSEPMSILRYAQGEYYRPHFDFFNPNLDAAELLLKDGGQRVASAVTYLSAPLVGGGTSFPNVNVTVPAQQCSSLWFRNCSRDGEIDPRSLHAGDTVHVGEKWVVTKWFREKPTSYLKL